jgi:RNAse (barnase) inhibitor barstar
MNPMNSLRNLLPDSKRAGVYRLAIDSDAIVAAAKTAGLQVFKIDLAKARGKSGLFDAFSNTLKFPKHCGKNWDALNDCLTDLAWLNGSSWVLILANCKPFVAKYQADFDVALELLEGVAASWQEDGKPFWLFIPDQPGWSADLPEIALG